MNELPKWKEGERLKKLSDDFDDFNHRMSEKYPRFVWDGTKETLQRLKGDNQKNFNISIAIIIAALLYVNYFLDNYLGDYVTGFISATSIILFYKCFSLLHDDPLTIARLLDPRTDAEIKEESELFKRKDEPEHDMKLWLIDEGALHAFVDNKMKQPD